MTPWQDVYIKKYEKNIIEQYIRNTSHEQFNLDKMSLQLENVKI